MEEGDRQTAVFPEAEAKVAVVHTVEVHHLLRAQRFVLNGSLPMTQANIGQIVVEKLTKNVNEDHLREIFGNYGAIQDVDMPMNRQCM
jgi:RNA recognition motif-containing protein